MLKTVLQCQRHEKFVNNEFSTRKLKIRSYKDRQISMNDSWEYKNQSLTLGKRLIKFFSFANSLNKEQCSPRSNKQYMRDCQYQFNQEWIDSLQKKTRIISFNLFSQKQSSMNTQKASELLLSMLEYIKKMYRMSVRNKQEMKIKMMHMKPVLKKSEIESIEKVNIQQNQEINQLKCMNATKKQEIIRLNKQLSLLKKHEQDLVQALKQTERKLSIFFNKYKEKLNQSKQKVMQYLEQYGLSFKKFQQINQGLFDPSDFIKYSVSKKSKLLTRKDSIISGSVLRPFLCSRSIGFQTIIQNQISPPKQNSKKKKIKIKSVKSNQKQQKQVKSQYSNTNLPVSTKNQDKMMAILQNNQLLKIQFKNSSCSSETRKQIESILIINQSKQIQAKLKQIQANQNQIANLKTLLQLSQNSYKSIKQEYEVILRTDVKSKNLLRESFQNIKKKFSKLVNITFDEILLHKELKKISFKLKNSFDMFQTYINDELLKMVSDKNYYQYQKLSLMRENFSNIYNQLYEVLQAESQDDQMKKQAVGLDEFESNIPRNSNSEQNKQQKSIYEQELLTKLTKSIEQGQKQVSNLLSKYFNQAFRTKCSCMKQNQAQQNIEKQIKLNLKKIKDAEKLIEISKMEEVARAVLPVY